MYPAANIAATIAAKVSTSIFFSIKRNTETSIVKLPIVGFQCLRIILQIRLALFVRRAMLKDTLNSRRG